MSKPFAILIIAASLLGCSSELAREAPAPSQLADPSRAAELDALRLSLNEARAAWSEEVDTAEVRRDLARFVQLIRDHPGAFESDRIEAAQTYSWLGEADLAVRVLKEGLAYEPDLAQFVGDALTYHGQNEAAQGWYRRGFETTGRTARDSMGTVEGAEAELYTGAWLSLIWLAYGRHASLDSLAALPAVLREPHHVQFIACYARFAEPIDWVRAHWENVHFASARPEPYEECIQSLR